MLIVAVVGATGELGQLIIESLLVQAKDVTVRAIVRKSNSALDALKAKSPKSVEIVLVDYASAASLDAALKGVYAVASTLQGLEEVLHTVQSRLLEAALRQNVKRFIPSDYSYDYLTGNFPKNCNRNSEIRKGFHKKAGSIIAASGKKIEFLPVMNGMFTDLFPVEEFQIVNYSERTIAYFGPHANVKQEFTTYRNTAEFVAYVLVDPKPIAKSHLHISGHTATINEIAALVSKATGETFVAKQALSLGFTQFLIFVLKHFAKKGEVMPQYQKLQYGYCMALGLSTWKTEDLHNNMYPGIKWTRVDEAVKLEYEKKKKAGLIKKRSTSSGIGWFVAVGAVAAVGAGVYLYGKK
ncbi:hypothetical protein HDU99_009394 [Rhizoclosmatium hyalinum]|nr:hypothetical protein HDU99_009394 [Rhizoclosmatium hyalinum]